MKDKYRRGIFRECAAAGKRIIPERTGNRFRKHSGDKSGFFKAIKVEPRKIVICVLKR